MTTANKITIARIFLIPVFVGLAIYYARSVKEGQPVEGWRWGAIAVFLVASLSDGLDGFIARKFNQRSRLGVILDPLADKGLLLAALITLTHSGWPNHFPLWFPILVIGRDVMLIAGALVLKHVVGDVRIQPHWTGKVATFLQMVSLSWVMLGLSLGPDNFFKDIVIFLAGAFTFVSGCVYFYDGIHQFHASGHGEADAS
ncbi:MAG: CDP-diacylglycerol--glycerol-3-phosphate 3-phosphatidyltransferase [Verrucomicrobiota bacterium]